MFNSLNRAFGSPERNERRKKISGIKESFSTLEAEGRDVESFDDCEYVLTECEKLIAQLEEIDERHQLLESIRTYMQKYLPVYTDTYNKRNMEKAGFAPRED